MTQQLPSPAKIRATRFELTRQQAFNPLRGGHHQTADFGEALWQCEIETTPLSREQGGAWKFLLASLRGFARTLFLWDAFRARPLAYRSAADGALAKFPRSGVQWPRPRKICSLTRAWGTPKITAVDRANGRIRVEGFIAGAAISVGDYGHWDDGPARRLHICDAAVADSAGIAWLTVEPAPPETSANLPAAFEMYKASAEMVVTETAAPYSAPVVHEASLKGVQILRRS